jgi:hypothetical protein
MAHQTIGLATLGRNSASLKGHGAAPVQLCLDRGPVAPSGEVPPRSRVGRPLGRDSASLGGWTPPGRPTLERGPVSIESRAPPRASLRLARGYHGPTVSIPAPPAGAFNALTFAGAQVKDESTPLRARESRPGTAPPTLLARPSPPLCNAMWRGQQQPLGTVPPTPVRPTCHTLEEGRRSPRREDEQLLRARTGLRRDVKPVGAVTSVAISPVRPPPPSPMPSRPLHHHPRRCGSVRRQDAATPATVPPYGLTSMAPSSPHMGGCRTGDLYTATLEAAPGRAQDTPNAPPEARFARTAVYSATLYTMPPHVDEIVRRACKLPPPWPIKGGAVP